MLALPAKTKFLMNTKALHSSKSVSSRPELSKKHSLITQILFFGTLFAGLLFTVASLNHDVSNTDTSGCLSSCWAWPC